MLILEDIKVKDVLPLNILRNSQFFPRIAHKCKCPRVRMRVRAFHSDVLFLLSQVSQSCTIYTLKNVLNFALLSLVSNFQNRLSCYLFLNPESISLFPHFP